MPQCLFLRLIGRLDRPSWLRRFRDEESDRLRVRLSMQDPGESSSANPDLRRADDVGPRIASEAPDGLVGHELGELLCRYLIGI